MLGMQKKRQKEGTAREGGCRLARVMQRSSNRFPGQRTVLGLSFACPLAVNDQGQTVSEPPRRSYLPRAVRSARVDCTIGIVPQAPFC